MMNPTALALALAASVAFTGVSAGSPANAQQTENAAEMIIAGEQRAALMSLEKQIEASPNDPALLINLGVAYAQLGLDAKARLAFEDALASPNPQELDTADGRTIDSRRLARQALQMLERGEFRTVPERRTDRASLGG